MAIWKNKVTKKDKPWGFEDRINPYFQTGAKVIHIKKGHRTSLKKLKTKNQILLCLVGCVRVHTPEEEEFTSDGGFTLHPGEQLAIEKNSTYRIEGLQDSVLIEITDSSRSETLGGIEMIDDDYGRVGNHPSLVNLRFY